MRSGDETSVSYAIDQAVAPRFDVSSYTTALNLHAGVLESTEIWIPTQPLHVEKGIILTSYLPVGGNEEYVTRC